VTIDDNDGGDGGISYEP